jgi:hypothetical protein
MTQLQWADFLVAEQRPDEMIHGNDISVGPHRGSDVHIHVICGKTLSQIGKCSSLRLFNSSQFDFRWS